MRLFLGIFLLILMLWKSNAQEATLSPEPRPIASLEWSPDGGQIAVGFGLYAAEAHDYAVQLIDAETGELIKRLDANSDDVPSVDWNPDGTKLVMSGGNDNLAWVWNVSTAEQIAISQPYFIVGRVLDIWSPDGSQIANISYGIAAINLWNPENGERLSAIRTSEFDQITSLDWSPDGTKLVTVHVSGAEVIWDATTGAKILELEKSDNGVRSIDWSSDGIYLAAGSLNHTISVWDASSGEHLTTLEGHSDFVRAVRFSSDGLYLASASDDGTVRVWDAESLEEAAIFDYGAAVYSVDWSPNGEFLAFGGLSSDGQDAQLEIVPFGIEAAD
jgi:WD40 repeat protein